MGRSVGVEAAREALAIAWATQAEIVEDFMRTAAEELNAAGVSASSRIRARTDCAGCSYCEHPFHPGPGREAPPSPAGVFHFWGGEPQTHDAPQWFGVPSYQPMAMNGRFHVDGALIWRTNNKSFIVDTAINNTDFGNTSSYDCMTKNRQNTPYVPKTRDGHLELLI